MPHAFKATPHHPAVPFLVRLHANLGGKILGLAMKRKQSVDFTGYGSVSKRLCNSFQFADSSALTTVPLALRDKEEWAERAAAFLKHAIGAENYYQHAEHYFRSLSPDRETT